jgi:3-phenylpropionate/trans-cinnamate dioxygenase ferredoxin reductase subunit
MSHYPCLIVGGGMTAASVLKAIRKTDPAVEIGFVSAESYPPYQRPPLSKGLWKGGSPDEIWYEFPDQGVDVFLERRIVSLDAAAKQVRDDRGEQHSFDRLLLATGGKPRRLPDDGGQVIYFRTYLDYQRLRALVAAGKRFVVIGGGFIGCEIAAALRLQECEVTMIVPEDGLGALVFPADLSAHVAACYRDRGVDVVTGEKVARVLAEGGASAVVAESGRRWRADGVVAGLGIVPNVQLAADAGLETDRGIVVDRTLRTSDPDIFAAGDVATFTPSALGQRLRVEHEDAAVSMGTVAGHNMAGGEREYDQVPFFYSDLFDLGYEAVGPLDARLETVSDWKEELREGVVYYLERGRVRGVLLWNVWDKVPAARELIASPGPFRAADLSGRIG